MGTFKRFRALRRPGRRRCFRVRLSYGRRPRAVPDTAVSMAVVSVRSATMLLVGLRVVPVPSRPDEQTLLFGSVAVLLLRTAMTAWWMPWSRLPGFYWFRGGAVG